jgi:hypothetical protein
MTRALAVLAVLFLFKPAIGQTTLAGTMRHTTIEGGCWYLEGDDGKHYELIGDNNVIAPLHQDGKYVAVEVEPAKGAASICMVGDIMHVIRQAEIRRGPYDPPYGDILVDGIMKRTRDGAWYIERKKHHVRYEFQDAPKALRHVGLHVHKVFHIILDPRSSPHHMDGIILADHKPRLKTKMIEKKYDNR